MTHRERMLATIRGEPADQIPWAPRMDLWSIAQRARGTLPKLNGLNTAQLADALGLGCHAWRCDCTLPRGPRDLLLRGLGLDNHPDYPYRVELRGLPVDFRQQAGNIRTVVHTAAGDVVMQLELTPEMARNGISVLFVQSYPLRSVDDLEAVAQVFDHLEVVPTPGAYSAFQTRIGERGLAVAGGPISASPMQLIMHELMSTEEFFYWYADERDRLRDLARRMTPFFESALRALLECDAEVVFWGANYDQDLTWPPFFQEEIAPWLKRVADALHSAGKLLLTHCDGENRKLLPLYPACGFDIAESVCPAPMTQCTLAQLRAGFGPKTTVWGGIPSVVLLDSQMSAHDFDAYLDAMFGALGTGERLILGVSDNVPPDANLARMEEIKRRIVAFGPVGR